MAPKTLYDVVRPICWRLNMFGYNYGNEEPEGWVRRGYKWALKCLLLYSIWRILIANCKWVHFYLPIRLAAMIWESLQISSFCLQFFFMKEIEIEKMMKRMKQHPAGKMSQMYLNKQLIPFRIYTAIFVIYFLFCTSVISGDTIMQFVEGRLSFLRAVFVFLQAGYDILILQFPCLVCILPCVVACYCRAEMEEAIEEIKRIKSPLRRAKAKAKLIEKYQQLTELASDTDRALSTAMYVIKWMFFISFAAVVLANILMSFRSVGVYQNNIVEYNYVFVLIVSALILMYFPLFQYFYLAPAANQMFERMNRTIAECGSNDDQWLSRDPILRPHLLKMRMEVVERVSHMATEDPPFTLFGEVLDKDIIFTVFLELIDMCNNLSEHQAEEEMKLNRIYYNFMRKCIDCKYWYKLTQR